MRNRILISLMVMVTALGISKVVLPFFSDMEQPIQVAQAKPIEQTEVKHEVDSVEQFSAQAEWLANELIPSAEAAEGMALAEEQETRADGAAKVIELREKQQQLNTREKELDEREEEAKAAVARAQDKITELEQLESRIQAILDEEKSIKDKKIKRLTAVYESMKAERAAPVIAKMELDIVVKIFSRMSEKQVGKILMFLPPQKAVTISQALTKRIASVK